MLLLKYPSEYSRASNPIHKPKLDNDKLHVLRRTIIPAVTFDHDSCIDNVCAECSWLPYVLTSSNYFKLNILNHLHNLKIALALRVPMFSSYRLGTMEDFKENSKQEQERNKRLVFF